MEAESRVFQSPEVMGINIFVNVLGLFQFEREGVLGVSDKRATRRSKLLGELLILCRDSIYKIKENAVSLLQWAGYLLVG